MPFVETSTCDVYYETHGEGPTLLLAHGVEGNHAIWWQQVPHFRENYKVVTLDLAGSGLTKAKWGEYTVSDHPEIITAVLNDSGAENAVLVGQAVGAVSALRVALDNTEIVRGVVVAHGLGGLIDPDLRDLAGEDRVAQNELPEEERLLSKDFLASEPEKAFLFQQIGTFRPITAARVSNTLSGYVKVEDVQKGVAAGLNVTFLQGGRDQGLSSKTYDVLKEKLPEANHEYVADAPHSYYWEQPEAFNATLDSILDKIHQTV